MAGRLYIGLMSGTSLDGVDAVLARLAEDTTTTPSGAPSPAPVQVLAAVHRSFADDLRGELLALNSPGDNELHRAALAANAVSRVYAQAVRDVLAQAGCPADEVAALGAHGQTVRHRPGEFDGLGYSVQLLNGALLAESTGIVTACDFRSRDLAAGGQGAPLVPAFHARCFAQAGCDVAVLNLGGIANLSLLPAEPAQPVRGFDCGPGNVLMDLWCQRQRGQAYDVDGSWAASGHPVSAVLSAALTEPFFSLPPPKSTGRDLFNAEWINRCLAQAKQPSLAAQDVQASWAELTAQVVLADLARHLPGAQRLVVCGGGARNRHVMSRLSALAAKQLPALQVLSSDTMGTSADQVEALAFAWLAQALLQGQPGNLPAVTGARGLRVLGALYPA